MASPPPTEQPPANKFTNDCMTKFIIKCLFGQVTVFAVFFCLSVTHTPRTQNAGLHRKLTNVATALEIYYAIASILLASLYWRMQRNFWEFFVTKILLTSLFSIGFTALILCVISMCLPEKLIVTFITILCIITFFIIVIPLIPGLVTAKPSSEVCVPSHVIDMPEVESTYLETKSFFSEEGHSVLAKCKHNLTADDFHDLAEMVHALRRLSFAVTLDNANLVNILATGHTIILKTRSCRRVFNGRERNIESEDEQEVRMMAELELQLKRKCNELVSLIDQHFIPSTECAESLVFLHKMKGDYFHYLAELREGLNSDAFRSLEAYEKAIKFAALALSPSNPIRLSLALNCAVLHYEILNSRQRAYEIARLAYDEAVTSEISYPDSNVVMERIKEKLIYWSDHVVEKGENKSRVPAGGVRWFFWN